MRLRRLPSLARVVLLLVVLSGLSGAIWVYEHRAILGGWLQREMRIPLYLLLFAALSCGLVAIAAYWLVKHTRGRRQLKCFFAEWLAFKTEFELLCLRIDGYFMKTRNETGSTGDLDKLLPFVREYWQRRSRLREHIFKVGESHLASLRSARWEALKTKSTRFREGEYLTPFSFLVDLGNPIAEWNHHHDEIWEALHLADEFVEYLLFRYPALKKINASAKTPNKSIKATGDRSL